MEEYCEGVELAISKLIIMFMSVVETATIAFTYDVSGIGKYLGYTGCTQDVIKNMLFELIVFLIVLTYMIATNFYATFPIAIPKIIEIIGLIYLYNFNVDILTKISTSDALKLILIVLVVNAIEYALEVLYVHIGWLRLKQREAQEVSDKE